MKSGKKAILLKNDEKKQKQRNILIKDMRKSGRRN